MTLLLFSVNTPFWFALDSLEEKSQISYFEISMDVIFLIDIFINFNSAIENKFYKVLDDRKVIAKSYL